MRTRASSNFPAIIIFFPVPRRLRRRTPGGNADTETLRSSSWAAQGTLPSSRHTPRHLHEQYSHTHIVNQYISTQYPHLSNLALGQLAQWADHFKMRCGDESEPSRVELVVRICSIVQHWLDFPITKLPPITCIPPHTNSNMLVKPYHEGYTGNNTKIRT